MTERATTNHPSPPSTKQSLAQRTDAPLPAAPPGTSAPPEYSALDSVEEEKDISMNDHRTGSQPQPRQQPVRHTSPQPQGMPQPQSQSPPISQVPPAAHGQGFSGPGISNGPGTGGIGISNVSGYGQNVGHAGVYNPQGMQMCYEGKHDFRTNYGIIGIIFAIVCFPCGLIGLCLDRERICTRCGTRQV